MDQGDWCSAIRQKVMNELITSGYNWRRNDYSFDELPIILSNVSVTFYWDWASSISRYTYMASGSAKLRHYWSLYKLLLFSVTRSQTVLSESEYKTRSLSKNYRRLFPLFNRIKEVFWFQTAKHKLNDAACQLTDGCCYEQCWYFSRAITSKNHDHIGPARSSKLYKGLNGWIYCPSIVF